MHMQTCLTRAKNQLFFTYKSIVLHCGLKRLLFTGHYLSRKSRIYSQGTTPASLSKMVLCDAICFVASGV